MKFRGPSLEQTQYLAFASMGIASAGLIALLAANQLWFLTGLCALILTAWVVFALLLGLHAKTWSNLLFYILCLVSMAGSLNDLALWWLIPILLSALGGWDLAHTTWRLVPLLDAGTQQDIARILQHHYRRLGGVSLVIVTLIVLVNSVKLEAHFTWSLFWLLVAGAALRYIVHWIRKR